MADIERTLRAAARDLAQEPPEEQLRALPERALRDGLLDVGYGYVDSPLGRLTVAATPRGLIRVAYPSNDPDHVLEELAAKLSPRLLEAPAFIDEVRRELDEYFEGRRQRFDLPLDWTLTRGFVRRVLRATARIDFGHVRSYREVARSAGNERAVRAAGNALGSNPMPVVVPCHRVVRTGGGLGGYTGGLERKQFLLGLEGVVQDV
jgi:methylated-DNA-[protein]-cysteine S-methyltransferase